MESNGDGFKVSVESLHTTRVKEINYDGEETYEGRPSLSQKLSELAQHVDFREDKTEEDNGRKEGNKEEEEEEGVSGPTTKKPSHRWPWEFTHSKLKQALTEVSVLSDVLQIAHNHRQYLSLDPVYVNKRYTLPPSYQYQIKKKALDVASKILRKGAEPLKRLSSQTDHKFYRALYDLRRRWILRRTANGVSGDLSYRSAGSLYAQSVQFEVHKGIENTNDILSVVVPQELRGRSEVVIFLADRPIKEVVSLDSLLPSCFIDLQKQQLMLTPWEQRLKSAQNVLFNEELFAQLAKEAFDQRSSLQGEVLTDRINIPLTTDVWLSVLLVREYERDKKNDKPLPPPDSLPTPNWELTVAFKQLLRANHQYIAMPRPPRPSNSRHHALQETREAGASAYSTTALKKLEYDYSIFNKLIKMARHIDAQRKVNDWLSELSQSSNDPNLMVALIPSLSLTSTTFAISYASQSVPLRWKLDLGLSDGAITWAQKPDGHMMSIPVDKERLLGALKRQAVLYILKALEQIAVGKKWDVLLESTLPHPSLILMKQKLLTSLASSILIESPNGTRLELLIEYGQVIASVSNATHSLNEDDIDIEHKSTQPDIITISGTGTAGAGLLSSVHYLYYLVEWVRSVALYFLPPNLEMFDSVFEIVAEQSNLSIDKVRYVTLFFISFPLASFLRVVLNYSYTGTTIRHTVSIILGLFFGWLCFKWQVLYLIGFVLVGYILLVTLPPSVVQRYSLFYGFLSTSIAHIYRLYTDYGGYTLDFTGPLMLLVQRVSYVAYAYHDGVARNKKDLNEDQKKLKISVIPSLLEYFGYNFCFLTFLAGPTFAYKEYDDFITGRNITEAKNKQSSTEPSPLIPILKTFIGSMISMSIVIVGASWTDSSLILDPNIFFLRRIFNIIVYCIILRNRYYFTFLITESICIAGGLGFSGYDNEGKAVWDNAKTIGIKGFELGINPRDLGMSWNIRSSLWVRRIFYERGWGLYGANIASAVWHGFYPGYYLTLFVASLTISVGRKLRHLLWHRFQSPRHVKILYDISSTLLTSICRDFVQVTFILLVMDDILTFWRYCYGGPFIALIILTAVLPNKKKEKKAQ